MLASGISKAKRNVLILDPMLDSGWPENPYVMKTADPIVIHNTASRITGAHIYIDEAAIHVGRSSTLLTWLFQFGRHWGHNTTLIAQSPTQLSPFARSQCETAYVFKSTSRVGELLHEEDGFLGKELLEIANLQRYHFYRVHRYDALRHYKLVKRGNGFTTEIAYDNGSVASD
jgi:hypothetical protein